MSAALEAIERQHAVEQWYYREARLLDGRQYQSWLALCHPEIRYVVPGRGNPLVDNARRGTEEMISVDHELEGRDSDRLPIRDETLPYLMVRAERAYKPNSWAEHPPARTRRETSSRRPDPSGRRRRSRRAPPGRRGGRDTARPAASV